MLGEDGEAKHRGFWVEIEGTLCSSGETSCSSEMKKEVIDTMNGNIL